jgi:hypothetical protein
MNGRLTALVAVAALLGATAPAAHATTEMATGGAVTATLSYVQTRDFTYEDLHLKIARGGVVALDAPIVAAGCEYGCWPGSVLYEDRASVDVLDLDGDGEPEVVVDLFTGGAHCCLIAQIFSSQGGLVPSYARDEHNFLDPGYRLRDLNGDGISEFQSADGRFAYAISSFAGSGMPVQVWRFQRGELIDVTGEFPDLIRADSRYWWKRYRRYASARPPYNDPGLGALAAWAGDEYRLGHGRRVQKELERALRRGWLDSYFGSGRRTVRNLNTLLRETGYR